MPAWPRWNWAVLPAAGLPWAPFMESRQENNLGRTGTWRADDLLFAPIAQVAARYRDGSLSPVTVTELTLARIAALNPTLNAFITVTATQRWQQPSARQQSCAPGMIGGCSTASPLR